MKFSALLLIASIGTVGLAPVEGKTRTPISRNATVGGAKKPKARKFRPQKYKAPKHNKKPARASIGKERKRPQPK